MTFPDPLADLIARLTEGQLDETTLPDILHDRPADTDTIRNLRREAETAMLVAPRRAWALARLAHTFSQTQGNDELIAHSALTLATSLNMLGEFGLALPLAQSAVTHLQGILAAQAEEQIALAHHAYGRLGLAREALLRARGHLASATETRLEQARCDRLEAALHDIKGNSEIVNALLQSARQVFEENGATVELARCDRQAATLLLLSDDGQAMTRAENACRLCEGEGYPLELAHSTLCLSDALDGLNRYEEALSCARHARDLFAQERATYFVASTDIYIAVFLWRMNHHAEALSICEQAERVLHDQHPEPEPAIMRCEINHAIILYSLNRYEEALTLYERAAQRAESLERPPAAARCYENAALIHHRLGQYGRALAGHRQARNIFAQLAQPTAVAICEQNMARTCQALGQDEEALAHFRSASRHFTELALPIYAARCDVHLADLHLQQQETAAAITCLERARETFVAADLPSYIGACDQMLAVADGQAGHAEQGLRRLAQARTALADQGQPVDVALCDLVAGDLHCDSGDVTAAEQHYRTALQTLDPGFPDQAWRAEWGLARCQMSRQSHAAAKEHYRRALRHLAVPRQELLAESLSSGYHRQREALYEEALALAVDEDQRAWALQIVEAGKARSFLSLLQRRGRSLRAHDRLSPYLQQRLQDEAYLRCQIEEARARLHPPEPADAPLRDAGQPQGDLADLARLCQEYETVIQDLRLAGDPQVVAYFPEPFDAQGFCQRAAAHFPTGWAALAYYLTPEHLTTFHLNEEGIKVTRRPLSAYDRHILHQCTDPDPAARELVYRNTLGGKSVPNRPGEKYRKHLHRLLIPERLLEDTPSLLLIAPHRALHHLPFQALLEDETCLVERAPLRYTPSLQVVEMSWERERERTKPVRALVCGLSEYGERAAPLPHTRDEVAFVRSLFGGRSRTLWGREANRQTLLQMSHSGELRHYSLIHVAAHALLDPLSPWQSRVLLAGGDLTVADVLDLSLDAALVVLSACQSGLGEVGSGDEVVSLARALFLAGARQLMVTLWGAEDEATLTLMRLFYERWGKGASAAQALAEGQRQMIREGYAPFHWAPFVIMGVE